MQIAAKTFSFIEKTIKDPDLKFVLSKNYSAKQSQHRQSIRNLLAEEFTAHFSREQLANLSDLNIIPSASEGYFSITHNQHLGGFSYSKFSHGFDAESISRISKPVIDRTSSEPERASAPNVKFLWVAKEAAFKALNVRAENNANSLVVTDLICKGWKSHPETEVCSFRITSEKTIEQSLNLGFVFSEEDVLFAIYFR